MPFLPIKTIPFSKKELMEVAMWWIIIYKLEYFEKVVKIKKMKKEGVKNVRVEFYTLR